ncbi:MAG: alpha/beta hydrolase [Acidobacteriota bacterium]
MRHVFIPLVLATTIAGGAMGRSLQDVEYVKSGGQSLRMDAYIPDGKGPYPAAVIVHGGAWVTGDKQRSVRPLFQPLSQGGMAWFSINYRLASGNDPASLISLESLAALTGAADDVRNAVVYIRQHATELNVDPDRLVLIGESAGAQLASMAGLRPSPGKPVQAVVAFYSPSDLVDLVTSSNRIPDALKKAVKGSPLETFLMAGLKQLSPQTWVTREAPPFLMIHGTADALVPFQQSEAMCGALKNAGARCELFPVAGAGHGITFWEPQASMTAYKAKMMDWLTRTLGLDGSVAVARR